jgi:hypothetical protein
MRPLSSFNVLGRERFCNDYKYVNMFKAEQKGRETFERKASYAINWLVG